MCVFIFFSFYAHVYVNYIKFKIYIKLEHSFVNFKLFLFITYIHIEYIKLIPSFCSNFL